MILMTELTDLSSLRSQNFNTRPVIPFSLKMGASFSMEPFSSVTCPNKFINSSQLSFDKRVCEIS